jgi:hypothetical protein
MKTCRNCIHYRLCEYSTIQNVETKCKDHLHVDYPTKFLKEFVLKLKENKTLLFFEADDPGYVGCIEAIPVKSVDNVLKEMGIDIFSLKET